MVRIAIGITGILMVVVALMFTLQIETAQDMWPWGGYGTDLEPLSMFFISSIAAAIAAPLLWIAATGNIQASPAGALNLAVAFGGIAAFATSDCITHPGHQKVLAATVFFWASLIANLVVYFSTARSEPKDPLRLPRPVTFSFAVFSIVLILVGGALVAKSPNVLPWAITGEGSVVYGWIFLGASVYFLYAICKPFWENAAGPLLGFLAYDLVLIVPFLQHFSNVKESQRLSLILYTIVVVYSGLLAMFYLFAYPSTRLIARRRNSTS